MKQIRKIVISALLALPLATQASDWQSVAEATDTSYSIDFSSISQVKNFRKAWVREDSLKEQETNDYQKKKYRSGKHLYYFDCAGRRLGAVQKVLYEQMFGKGEVVQTISLKFTEDFLSEATPDSVGERLLEVACSSAAERAKIKAKNKAEVDALLNPAKSS